MMYYIYLQNREGGTKGEEKEGGKREGEGQGQRGKDRMRGRERETKEEKGELDWLKQHN